MFRAEEEQQMSVRKRVWRSNGEPREAWVVDYFDQHGKRHLRTFARRRDADTYQAAVVGEVRAGLHIADSESVTIAEAGRLWIASGEAAELERATMETYRLLLDLHVIPLIGGVKISQLTLPMVRAFEDRLRVDRSPMMTRKAVKALGAILADAQERGLATQNVVRSLRTHRRRGKDRRADARLKGKLKVGVDIPSTDEIRTLIPHLSGRWRPLLLTAIFTGLRASELRGLRWSDVDLKRGELHVRQRADKFGTIGQPKSEAGERTVPFAPLLINTLREWKLACPKGDADLVFPNGLGNVERLANIINRGLIPAMIAAGLVTKAGRAKYSGLHSFRHFYASWCINRRADGGLELPAKVVQARMGHASITITMDTYGHLFPRGDDGAELAAAEKTFFG
jgi:integrase